MEKENIERNAEINILDSYMVSPEFSSRRVFFLGLPGSGVATAMARMAIHLNEKKGCTIDIINTDYYHIGKNEQLKICCTISGISFRGIELASLKIPRNRHHQYFYLPGLKTISEIETYKNIADSRYADLCLVIDSTRSINLNSDLILSAQKEGVINIIVTKLDIGYEVDQLATAICNANMKILMTTAGERIPTDVIFKKQL